MWIKLSGRQVECGIHVCGMCLMLCCNVVEWLTYVWCDVCITSSGECLWQVYDDIGVKTPNPAVVLVTDIVNVGKWGGVHVVACDIVEDNPRVTLSG